MGFDLTSRLVAGKGPDSIQGLHGPFADALSQLFAAAPPDIRDGLQITSGYRSPARQAELYAAATQKYGSPEAARRWVAPPGRSRHNHGAAVDLSFASPSVKAWVHQNAPNFGLAFPMSWEPWHVELAGVNGARAPLVPGQASAAAPASAAPSVTAGWSPAFNSLAAQHKNGLQTDLSRVDPAILDAAKAASAQTGVPLALLLGSMAVESHFDPRTGGTAGESGLMQITPDEAPMLNKRYGTSHDPATMVGNINLGALRYRLALDSGVAPRYGDLAAAYNRGEGVYRAIQNGTVPGAFGPIARSHFPSVDYAAREFERQLGGAAPAPAASVSAPSAVGAPTPGQLDLAALMAPPATQAAPETVFDAPSPLDGLAGMFSGGGRRQAGPKNQDLAAEQARRELLSVYLPS